MSCAPDIQAAAQKFGIPCEQLANPGATTGATGIIPSSASSTAGQAPVYWGTTTTGPDVYAHGGDLKSGATLGASTTTDQTKTRDEAYAVPWTHATDSNWVMNLQRKLIQAGLWSGTVDGIMTDDLVVAWDRAVDYASNVYIASGMKNNMTPWDALSLLAGSANPSTTSTSTDTSTDTTLTNPETAKGLISATLQQRLGRLPTDDEVASFIGALHGAESGSPTSSTTTTTAASGNRSSSTTTHDGLDPSQYAADYAASGKLGKEANTFTAGTEYYQALAGLL